MSAIYAIDWHQMFVPTGSLLELVVRGSSMYLLILAGFRVFRRDAGNFVDGDVECRHPLLPAALDRLVGLKHRHVEAFGATAPAGHRRRKKRPAHFAAAARSEVSAPSAGYRVLLSSATTQIVTVGDRPSDGARVRRLGPFAHDSLSL